MIGLLLVCGQTVWRITSVMSQCHADSLGLGGSAFAWGRVAGNRDDWWYHVICLLLVRGGPCGEFTSVVYDMETLIRQTHVKLSLSSCKAR